MIEKNKESSDISSSISGGQRKVDIIPLSEGAFTVDKSKLFVPFKEQEDDLQKRSVGSLLVEIQPFVVITSKDVLLLDTGLGFTTNGGKMQIHANMERMGIRPSDITKVLLSHLHKDHSGGVSHMTSGLPNEHRILSFTNATYYVRQKELEFALDIGFPSFIPEELQVLQQSNRVHFLQEEEGSIDNYIFYQQTGAHSPYHQVFWIREAGETIFYGGDDAPQLQQMKIKYKTKYDHNPEKAMQLRQEWWNRGNKEGWKFLFYHDIKTPVYKQV